MIVCWYQSGGARGWTAWGLDDLGVAKDPESGRIIVDAAYRTSVPSIYAIGDIIAGPMLAHKASAEGVAAAECMAGLPGDVNYDTIPSVIYTSPQAAGAGMTQETAKNRGIPFLTGVYPFSGTGRGTVSRGDGRICQACCP